MAYYRRSRFSRYRRKPYRRFRRRIFRGSTRRTSRIPRRLNQNTTYRFSRIAQYQISTNASTGAATGAFIFSLGELAGLTDFTSLFDFYRIRGVSVTFIPKVTQTTAALAVYGNFYWIADYDDATPPTLGELEQKQGVRYKYAVGRAFKTFLRPKALTNIYNGAASTDAHMVGKQGWINAANTGVPHYGLKWAWNGTNESTMDVIVRYYVECKGVQ